METPEWVLEWFNPSNCDIWVSSGSFDREMGLRRDQGFYEVHLRRIGDTFRAELIDFCGAKQKHTGHYLTHFDRFEALTEWLIALRELGEMDNGGT